MRRKEDLKIVNEISDRVGSLALIFGDSVEVDPDISCLCLRINEGDDISKMLKEIDLPLRRESWRVERNQRLSRSLKT